MPPVLTTPPLFDGDLANMVFYYGRQEKDGFLVPEENIVHFNKKRILHRRITDFGVAKDVGEDFFKIDGAFKKLDKT